jgi:hypothetical protein
VVVGMASHLRNHLGLLAILPLWMQDGYMRLG